MTVAWTPHPSQVWPSRRHSWSASRMDPRLRAAIVADPTRAATVVVVRYRGRNYRWASRDLSIASSAVHGGSLFFEGKLLSDGSFSSSLTIDQRVTDLSTFSVDSDNLDELGTFADGTAKGNYVPPVYGAEAEVSLVHPNAPWEARKVFLYGTLGGAAYGPDGQSLSFTVTPKWLGLDQNILPTIDATSWPSANEEVIGTVYPLAVGSCEMHRCVRVAYRTFMVNGIPIGSTVSAAYDNNGDAVPMLSDVEVMYDGFGRAVEVITVIADDDEIFCTVQTDRNGFLWKEGSESPGSIGTLMQWVLARLTGMHASDVDYSGTSQYRAQFLHTYGMSLDEETTARDLIESRLVHEVYGYVTQRCGKYGVGIFPFAEIPGTPSSIAHFVWGRELLSGGGLNEGDESALVSDFSGEWHWDPSVGEYANDESGGTEAAWWEPRPTPVPPTIDPDTSFFLRAAAQINGFTGSTEAVSFPDLRRWCDVRSSLRLDERMRGLTLRTCEYLGTTEVLVADPGDIVRITDPRQGFLQKPFVVLACEPTTRPVATLSLLEWVSSGDLFGSFGLPVG